MPLPVIDQLAPHEAIPTVGHHLLVPDWPAQTKTGPVTLTKEASKHLGQVLRIQPGEPISLTDGQGHIGQAVVDNASKPRVSVIVNARWFQPPWPNKLIIIQALPKAKKLDEVIRRACELGVDVFRPVMSARCDRKLDAIKAQAQAARWQAIADSAVEQCRRAWAMQVANVTPIPVNQPGIVLWEEATTPLAEVLADYPEGDITMLVGPEGGLTQEEVMATAMTPASVGPRILRTETAGVTAAALGAWHLGRLS